MRDTGVDQAGGAGRRGLAVPAWVRGHARFDEAIRASAANLIEVYEHNPLLNAAVYAGIGAKLAVSLAITAARRG